MSNPVLRAYLQPVAPGAQVIASVCTGALILAANGLVTGGVGTTHWGYYGVLERLGVRYVRRRWVEDGKVIMSAGVSAGIDMALCLAANLAGEETSRRVQLDLAYDPQPPFGGVDWDHLSPLFRIVRAGWTAAAPFVARRPNQLLKQGK